MEVVGEGAAAGKGLVAVLVVAVGGAAAGAGLRGQLVGRVAAVGRRPGRARLTGAVAGAVIGLADEGVGGAGAARLVADFGLPNKMKVLDSFKSERSRRYGIVSRLRDALVVAFASREQRR